MTTPRNELPALLKAQTDARRELVETLQENLEIRLRLRMDEAYRWREERLREVREEVEHARLGAAS